MGKYARPGSDGWTYKDQLQMEKWLNKNPITNAICGLLVGIIMLTLVVMAIPVFILLLIFFSPIWIPIAFVKGIFKRR